MIRRQAARVILLDGEGNIFLEQARDPVNRDKRPWWELPGGGIDPGETSGDAAARELYEEAGFAPELIEMGDVIWKQHVQFTFAGWHFDQDEHIHVAYLRGPKPEYKPAHLELLELHAFLGARWWPIEEVVASDEDLVPVNLREILASLQ